MQAAQYSKTGGPDQLQLLDLPVPKRKKGQVLLAVHACSINAADNAMLLGRFMPLLQRLPKQPGTDFAGTVAEADLYSRLKKGDKVFGFHTFDMPWGREGSLAQYVAVPEACVVPLPASVSFEEGCAAALTTTTALAGLPIGSIKPGMRVLVHGGAGGVGHLAIQLAKSQGAYVITTARAANKAFVQRLGADEVIDYQAADFVTVLQDKPVDLVLDIVGGDYTLRSVAVTKKSGSVTSILNNGWQRLGWSPMAGSLREILEILRGFVAGLLFTRAKVWPGVAISTQATLLKTANLLQSGKLRPHIDKTFPLEQIRNAFQYYERGVQGKVVIKIC